VPHVFVRRGSQALLANWPRIYCVSRGSVHRCAPPPVPAFCASPSPSCYSRGMRIPGQRMHPGRQQACGRGTRWRRPACRPSPSPCARPPPSAHVQARTEPGGRTVPENAPGLGRMDLLGVAVPPVYSTGAVVRSLVAAHQPHRGRGARSDVRGVRLMCARALAACQLGVTSAVQNPAPGAVCVI